MPNLKVMLSIFSLARRPKQRFIIYYWTVQHNHIKAGPSLLQLTTNVIFSYHDSQHSTPPLYDRDKLAHVKVT
jgi:hypothetical protein